MYSDYCVISPSPTKIVLMMSFFRNLFNERMLNSIPGHSNFRSFTYGSFCVVVVVSQCNKLV